MKNKISTTKAFLLALCFAFPFVTFSQDGSLDLTFDNDGIVNDIFVHKTSPEETLQIISEHALLGKKVNSEGYYTITT